jgi:hypothetical protein
MLYILMEYYATIKNTYYNMGEPWKHYAKWKKTYMEGPCLIWFYAYELCTRSKSIHTRNRLVVTRRELGGGRNEDWLLVEMEFILGVRNESGDSCMTVWTYQNSLTCVS